MELKRGPSEENRLFTFCELSWSRSWAILVPSWGHIASRSDFLHPSHVLARFVGASWGHLGVILGHLGVILGLPGVISDLLESILGLLGAIPVYVKWCSRRGETFIFAFRPPLGHKMAPRCPQDGPSRPQDGPKTAQDGPRWPQDGPRWPQDGPKTAQDGRKMGM